MAGSASFAFGFVLNVPEIDPSSAIGALTLLTGGLAVLRGRGKK